MTNLEEELMLWMMERLFYLERRIDELTEKMKEITYDEDEEIKVGGSI